MNQKTIYGRPAFGGFAEGKALVFTESIAGNTGGLGDLTGIVTESGNPAKGLSIKDRILVIPCSKGSNGFSTHFKSAKMMGICPAGWVITKMDSRLGVAVTSLGVPAVADFKNEDPVTIIGNDDWIRINGHTGVVEIIKPSP